MAITAAFADVGLRIIGPSRSHMLECAEIINQQSLDAIRLATDAFRQDAEADVLDVYRRLAGSAQDALDVSRPGPAVNLQSIVTRFLYRGHRFLFAGDMQFEKPEVNNDFLKNGVRRLRQRIAQEAPYSLVKLSHHGSFNAFSEQILQELGNTRLYGICAGESSKHHPNAGVLNVLDDHRDDIRWARTDRNGLVTVTFKDNEVRVKLTSGEISDPQPNSFDLLAGVGGEQPLVVGTGEQITPSEPPGQLPEVAQAGGGEREAVEVHAKIPHVSTRVTITVDVQPGSVGRTAPLLREAPEVGSVPTDTLRIAGGRQLPGSSLSPAVKRSQQTSELRSLRAFSLPFAHAGCRSLTICRLASQMQERLPNLFAAGLRSTRTSRALCSWAAMTWCLRWRSTA